MAPNDRAPAPPQTEAATLQARASVKPAPAATARTFVLTVLEGPDRAAQFVLDGTVPTRAMLGQSPGCDVHLTDRKVSRRHCSLELASPPGGSGDGATLDALRLTDLDSTNGTFTAGGMPVVDVFLRDGDAFRVGDTVLRVDVRAPHAPLAVSDALQFGRLVGGSLEMRRLYPLCERLAKTHVPVVIEGETGTGKELLAEALHEQGPRATGPFVVFDCTAVPPNLLESALFGHERGSFTGAISARRGVFEQAHGGTLLLDEIGDLDLPLQAKLLRAIERSEVQRLGSEKWLRADVRVLAATRRDLEKEVQAGRFRDDLFFRLAVARIELPPLRRRRGDVGLLARYFWREFGDDDTSAPEDLLRRFEDYAWPGNVRELSNAVLRRRALGDLASSDALTVAAPSAAPPGTTPPGDASAAPPGASSAAAPIDPVDAVLALDLPFPAARGRIVDLFAARYVERALERHGGNVARAAAASGIARRYFRLVRARYEK